MKVKSSISFKEGRRFTYIYLSVIPDTYISFISKYPFEEVSSDQNKSRPNLRKDEWQALLELKEDKNLVIKECDKGGACVIMDKQFYRKMEELLKDETTYKEIEKNIDAIVHHKIKALAEKHLSELTSIEIDYLTNFEYRISNMYDPPKIHKS